MKRKRLRKGESMLARWGTEWLSAVIARGRASGLVDEPGYMVLLTPPTMSETVLVFRQRCDLRRPRRGGRRAHA